MDRGAWQAIWGHKELDTSLKRNEKLIGNFFHSEFPGDKDLKDHGL